MRKIIVAACAAFLMATPVAEAKSLKDSYSGLYFAVAKAHGKRTPGRNIRRQGVKTKHGTRDASYAELARSIRTFRRWLAPPIPAAAPGDNAPTAALASAARTGGRWAIPSSIVQCESGGDYTAENTDNPDHPSGAYQIIDSTWKAHGGSTATAMEASPAEQDRIAAAIYDGGAGRGQWAC